MSDNPRVQSHIQHSTYTIANAAELRAATFLASRQTYKRLGTFGADGTFSWTLRLRRRAKQHHSLRRILTSAVVTLETGLGDLL